MKKLIVVWFVMISGSVWCAPMSPVHTHEKISEKGGVRQMAATRLKIMCEYSRRLPVLGVLTAPTWKQSARLALRDTIMLVAMVQSHQLKALKPCGLTGWGRTWRLTWTAAAAMGVAIIADDLAELGLQRLSRLHAYWASSPKPNSPSS